MYSVCLHHADHVRQYSIAPLEPHGWEVKFEEDRTLRHRAQYSDWHRVERELAKFRREVSELEASGWTPVQQ
jgi:hypothetical protein